MLHSVLGYINHIASRGRISDLANGKDITMAPMEGCIILSCPEEEVAVLCAVH